MDAKRYKIVKSRDKDGKWYHVELWRWYWPFWTKISSKYNKKYIAEGFVDDKINNYKQHL